MAKTVDIVVVGAGAVGLSLALSLARRTPYQILILDRRNLTQPAMTGRSMALSFSSERFYTALGLWQKLAPAATPITQVHTSIQNHFGSTRMLAKDLQVPALGQVLALDHLENTLRTELNQCDNVTLMSESCLTELQNAQQPVLLFESQGRVSEIVAQLVIGTDGAASQVAASADIGYDITEYGHQAVICHVSTSRSHQNIAYERFTQEGALALLPYGEKTATFVWTVPQEKAQALMCLPESDYLEVAQAQFGFRLGKWLSATKRVTYPLVQQIANQQCRDRIALLGNSAHTLHPIAAQGLNLSLRDVKVFSQCFNDAPALDNDTVLTERLQQYVQSVQTDQNRTITLTNQIAKQVSSDRFPASLKAAMLMGLELCWPLKRSLARFAMGLNI